MDIRFLQSLVAVVETGSIAAAARREKLSAAAISQRIQTLERLLDCTLLARGAHAAHPTDACLALLPRARRLISETAALKDDIGGESLAGDMRLGAISTALTGLFPTVLDMADRQAPGLKLHLSPGSSQHLYEQVLAGRLDAAVLVTPPFTMPKSLRLHILRREPLMLMTRAPMTAAAWRDGIGTTPYIRYDPQSWGGRHAADFLDSHGLTPDIRCDLDALETIALLVARGMGFSLVPHWPGLKPDGFHLTPLPGGEACARTLALLHPSTPGRARVMALLADLLRAAAKNDT